MSKGCSGISTVLAPPAMPACRAIHPACRPITSTTSTRWCDSAVVWRRSMASMAMLTAVSKPKVKSVALRSLSIVLGTPTTFTPRSCSLVATPSVSSPPMATSASTPRSARFFLICSTPPSTLNGLVREEPRMVPPRGRMPRTCGMPSSLVVPSSGPFQPSRKPTNSKPYSLTPLRTTARMTAFRPGQSPPPVSTPTRMSAPVWIVHKGLTTLVRRTGEGQCPPSPRSAGPRSGGDRVLGAVGDRPGGLRERRTEAYGEQAAGQRHGQHGDPDRAGTPVQQPGEAERRDHGGDVPGKLDQREVAAAQVLGRGLGGQRAVHRATEHLPDRVDRRPHQDDEDRERGREPGGAQHEQERRGEHRVGQQQHPPAQRAGHRPHGQP